MRVIKISKFLQEKDNVEWIIDNLLPNVGWTLFYGLRGLGKTTFAMQMCAALQTGTPFLTRKVKQTNIIYFQADSIVDEWKAMLKRITPKGSEAYTGIEVPAKALDTPQYVSTMAHFVAQLHPGFVVFDSLYNLTGKSINTEGVLIPIQMMKDICGNIPWMLIHHPPHNESRAAGHHSLGGNCSNEWSLLKTKLKIEKGRLVKDKEILLSRDEKGLWIPYTRGEARGYSDLYSEDI